ncbi:MAG: cytochrome c nitrite reductase small subunit [Opitutae bacterium]|nr:cytochrome c nitrite reductase small subunit [Opitutae bacterium]
MKTPTPTRTLRKHPVLLLAIIALFGVVAGFCTYTFTYARGFSYFSNDPRACMNCHIMRDQFDGWQKSPHHAVASCNDCHTPHGFINKYLSKAENGFWHSKGFTLQDFHEPIMIRPKNVAVLQQNCVACHAQIVDGINTHPGDPRKMLDCLHCHREVGHGPIR